MTPSTFVDATDLASWANRRDAQAALPQLVRRLVHATATTTRRAGFPAGEGVQTGGWDGIVEVEKGNAFVPGELSVWEMGTGRDAKGKADNDYDKRSKNPVGVDPSESTFVFVTARRWSAKEDWASTRRSQGRWKDVRAYDADSLEQWLEMAPAVHVWLSIRLGKHPEGAEDIDSFWEAWSAATQPETSSGLILAGREPAVQGIHAWLNAPTKPLVIRSESPLEALSIFAASIQLLPEEPRVEVASRIVIVSDVASWNLLTAHAGGLILIQTFEHATAHARATKLGHATVLTLGHADSVSADTIDVPRVSRAEAAKALIAMGVSQEKAAEFAALAHRSVMALRRRVAVVPELEQPEWARGENAGSLIPALLAGRWSDQTEGDREVIARLAGRGYSEVGITLARWSNAHDPPVRSVGAAWYLTSEEDAWLLLARHLTRDFVERFQKAVLDVLGTPDPSFELPEDRRWMAGVFGHKPPYSGLLKTGFANSLAIMGARGDSLATVGDVQLSAYAALSISKLLETGDWRVWASLPLPILAEAAPDEFLSAVERGLTGDQPPVAGLFGDESDNTFSSPTHTKLLWALEMLAWSEDYLLRATSSLGKLAELDPGGKWANRPSESLRSIFLPWIPQTTATLDRRLAAIDALRRTVPDVAWRLMNRLLPRGSDSQHPTSKPRWRAWAPEDEVRVSGREYGKSIHELVIRMLMDAGNSGGRWGDLIGSISNLSREDYDAVLAALEILDRSEIGQADLALLSSALRSHLSLHRSYPDSQWALPKEELDRFDALLIRFEPSDPLQCLGWLFGRRVTLEEGRERDWQEYQRAVSARQCGAVEFLYGESETNWLPEFIEGVELPASLGAAVAISDLRARCEDDLLREYVSSDNSKYHEFLSGLVLQSVHSVGLEWAQQKLAALAHDWTPAQRAMFCTWLPFDSATWALVEGVDEDTVREYWSAVSPMYVRAQDAEKAAQRLIAYDRPYVAIDLLHLYVRSANLSPVLVLEVLEKLVHNSPSVRDRRRLSADDLADLLEIVTGAEDVQKSRIAALEWALLPALGRHHYTPRLLQRELARSPEFFAEVVSLVYRAEGEEPHKLSDDEEARSMRAYELLESWRWHPLPGMPDGGEIQPSALRDWVLTARKILLAAGRLAVGDQTIGQVLSGSPAGNDGIWAHPCVRDLIEEIQSDDFEKGIVVGLLNSRGVVTRSLQEGGEREREEAKKYEDWAKAVSHRWGRTAALLRRMESRYLTYAKDEDQRAELREDLSE